MSERRWTDVPEWLALYRFKYGIADAEDRRRLRAFEDDYQDDKGNRAVTDYERRWTSHCTCCGRVISNESTPTQRLKAAGSSCPVEKNGFHRWESGYQGGTGK